MPKHNKAIQRARDVSASTIALRKSVEEVMELYQATYGTTPPLLLQVHALLGRQIEHINLKHTHIKQQQYVSMIINAHKGKEAQKQNQV